jgi:hypothetical protein
MIGVNEKKPKEFYRPDSKEVYHHKIHLLTKN